MVASQTSNPLRICHLGKYYFPASGGIETHVRTLAHAQARLGAQVTVFCSNHEPGPTRCEQDGPVRVVRFRRLTQVAKFDVCPELPAAIVGLAADLFHMQAPNPTMILALLLARPRLPLVVTYQSDHVRQKILGPLFRPIEHVFYRRVAAVLATSPTYIQGSALLQALGKQVEVLPMGIDLEPYLSPSRDDQTEAERIRQRYAGPIWLTCGRLIYYKGLMHAVRAMTRTPGTLLLVGEGPERSELEAEVCRLGLQARVVFIGDLPYRRIIPYYQAACALWFPSNARSEAFGLVQVEAMACGCPVINTALPGSGVAWVSRHEETGLTIPVDNPDALVAAANRLRTESGLRVRLSEQARCRAQELFDHHNMAERSLSVYHRILAARNGDSTPTG